MAVRINGREVEGQGVAVGVSCFSKSRALGEEVLTVRKASGRAHPVCGEKIDIFSP